MRSFFIYWKQGSFRLLTSLKRESNLSLMLESFFENFFKKEKEESLKYIQNCPLFSDLTKKEMSFLQKLLHTRIYTDGEVVFKPASGTGVYIILKGQVNILQSTNASNQKQSNLILSLKEGDFFGELALVHKGAYKNMLAQSSGNSRLLGFFQPDLALIMDSYPRMGNRILKKVCEILCKRLEKAEKKILQNYTP